MQAPDEEGIRIIAVHGFCGHRERSWTHIDETTGEEVMWLKDFLPDYVPGSRVMTFGYNLRSEGISAAEIKEKAIELLEALSADRHADEVSGSYPKTSCQRRN